VNCIALPRRAAAHAKAEFSAAAAAAGFQLRELPPAASADEAAASLHSVVGAQARARTL